ncbi:unnamed protein product, partial [marine sediment metagenome]
MTVRAMIASPKLLKRMVDRATNPLSTGLRI